MSINNNVLRHGNFTSSQAVKILGIASTLKVKRNKAMTYIQEKNMERELGRSLSTESDARPLQWGKLCEKFVHEQLGIEYIFCSEETLQHPKYDFWAGSPDCYKMQGELRKLVGEIKCPATLKSFFLLTQAENIYGMVDGFDKNGATYDSHTDGEKYLLQMVSNSILSGVKEAEFIVFVPKKSQLDEIRAEAEFHGIKWVQYATDDELPHLPDDCPISNMMVRSFEVPTKYVDELTEAMVEAGKLLIPRTSVVIHDTISGARVTVHDEI